ncbi:MAG: Ig-like domain-containing protein [Fidelibacterota bacterium]
MITSHQKLLLGTLFFMVYNLTCVEKPDYKTGPEITIISPESNETLTGMVSILIQSGKLNKIEKVELWVDGIQTGFYSEKEPFTINWETSAWEDGQYYISVRSYDKHGNFYDTEPFPVELDNVVNWTFYNSENSVLPESGLEHITTCGDGTVWAVYTWSSELYKFDGVDWEIVTVVKDSFPNFAYGGIECFNDTLFGGGARDHLSWPRFDNYKLFKYYNGDMIEFYSMGEKMSSSGGIEELEIDRKGNVWFSTGYNILGYFDGENFHYWKYGVENTDTTVAMYGDDGSVAGLVFDFDNNLWIAGWTLLAHHQAELGKWDGNQWTFQPMPHPEWVIHMIIDDQQNIWLVQDGGFLSKYD